MNTITPIEGYETYFLPWKFRAITYLTHKTNENTNSLF